MMLYLLMEKNNKKIFKKIKKINPNIKIFNGEYISTNYNKFKKNNYLVF